MPTAESIRQRLLAQGHEVVGQGVEQWQGDIPLPEVVARFYREVGPLDCTLSTHGNPFFIPSLARLWPMQAGYRWHGISGQRLEDWHDDWLVVADQGGDPFILDIASGRVLHDVHGGGRWQPDECFDDLWQMTACLACFDQVWEEAGDDLHLDDDSINPAYRERLVQALLPILGDRSSAETLAEHFEW